MVKQAKGVLSAEEKAVNTYKNTMIVFSGNMAMAFSSMIGDMAKAFTVNSETGQANVEQALANIPEQLEVKLDTMLIGIGNAFDDMKEENAVVYNKMFNHAVMQEGIDITTKYELPEGFKPFSEDLTKDDLMKYIAYVSLASQSEQIDQDEDPILKTYLEIFDWMQKAGKAFERDQEIQTFMASLR
jgi:predicted Zn-dependent protease with MMP-like domain